MPTTVFTATHYLILENDTAGPPLSWTGESWAEATAPFNNVVDFNDDGDLDAGSDYFRFPGASSTYTGYVITLNGNDYAIFDDGINAVIPFDISFDDLRLLLPLGVKSTSNRVDDASVINCFAEGTMINAPDGRRAVENLRVGQLVRTADGRNVPAKWIGSQTVHKLFSGPHMQPVRFRAGTLEAGVPHTDLTVTADHGMILDGLVINASALVNGDTIDFVPLDALPDQVTYYHVETEDHDVILANGAPAETFVDAVTRSHFDNYAEYLDLYGAERIVPEMDRPRIASQRLIPQAIKDRLSITAGADHSPRRRA